MNGLQTTRMELGSASASSSSSSTSGGSESLNGFKFGKKIYFEDVGVGVQDKFGGGPPSLPPKATGLPPPSPAKKRRRSMVQSGQPPRCQVEGCEADLSGAKANYSRHKMCGTHSKSPKVIVAGLEQRYHIDGNQDRNKEGVIAKPYPSKITMRMLKCYKQAGPNKHYTNVSTKFVQKRTYLQKKHSPNNYRSIHLNKIIIQKGSDMPEIGEAIGDRQRQDITETQISKIFKADNSTQQQRPISSMIDDGDLAKQ
ncbi:squamosa promoter-binding-like protein 11 [Olea europaea var. sylvestris]|uniref:squamosa promoter-binding-like protein 11 n=1 Tax=Olea europaea var. sylvestris TaxID=158386 RepID=UPI000C1D683B|nr:squamosa promoter-binding-like protein 11 [Olea europaea var. sylvestris]